MADSSGPGPSDPSNHENKNSPTTSLPDWKDRDDIDRLSRWPTFEEHLVDSRESQFHGRDRSELERYFPIGINNILLTVLGFVVGLSLSFRGSTAYERWADGRRYWAQLVQISRNLARLIWVHINERNGDDGKTDLLRKLSAINLILAFAVALKHKLRFEPDVAYEDLAGLIGHLDTFAHHAHNRDALEPPSKTRWKAIGEYLGVSFAKSNPRKLVKRSKKPLGHLPLEIINHLSAYVQSCVENDTLSPAQYQGQAMTLISTLTEILTGTERVLDTPLPAAYSIAISQIAWIYVMLLPFQLYSFLHWVTIPASTVAAYIIIGLLSIGSEIENPFGEDVNDLPLTTYCRQIAKELDIITATPPPKVEDFMVRAENLVLFPLSQDGYPVWRGRTKEDIYAALYTKVVASPSRRFTMDGDDLNTPSMTASWSSATRGIC
ncbi:Bestrophin, RFP-TM, chloride channel-domain-containing protein [Aspergillus floccosus]